MNLNLGQGSALLRSREKAIVNQSRTGGQKDSNQEEIERETRRDQGERERKRGKSSCRNLHSSIGQTELSSQAVDRRLCNGKNERCFLEAESSFRTNADSACLR